VSAPPANLFKHGYDKCKAASVGSVAKAVGAKIAKARFAIRGDIDPTPVNDRPPAREMEEAATAARFLRLHAAHLRRVHSGSARIAAVVEQAALSDAAAAALWEQMTHNRRAGTTWATNRLLSKPRTDHPDAEDAWRVFWLALDWRTYRTLTDDAELDADGYEAWIAEYYRRMFARR
jgi:hypothetical protein